MNEEESSFEAHIQDCLDIMTRTNKKAKYNRKTNSETFMLSLVAYGRALAWLEGHDIAFEYDSKRRRYVAKKDSQEGDEAI